jgi:hypothetical protein
MDQVCEFCGSLNFKAEMTAGDKNRFTLCCQKGKVQLAPIEPPPLIRDLLLDEHEYSRNYKEFLKDYNSSLGFASRRAQTDTLPGRGPYYMRIHGVIHHNLGSLRPNKEKGPKYAQIYILDAAQALQQRLGIVQANQIIPGN